MIKKSLGLIVAIIFLIFAVGAGFAVIKGLNNSPESVVKVGESITIPEGAEVKSAVSVGGSVTVYGHVIDDVVAVGGPIYLKDSASVGGDAVTIGGKIMREAGAITKGDIVEVSIPGIIPAVSFFVKGGILKGMALFALLTLCGFLVLAIILVALFTPQLGRVSGNLEKNLFNNFLVGLIGCLLFVPIIMALAVSIVGIILIPVWAMLFGAAGVLGYVSAGHLLGKKTLHSFRIVGKSMMAETLTGIVLLALVGLVPIGGFMIKALAFLCGLGAVYQTRFGTR